MSEPGLSREQAALKLHQDGPNVLPSAKPRTMLEQFIDVVREPMLLLLIAAGLISFTLKEPLEASFLMVSVVLVISISLYQTRKTDDALAALKSLTAPRADVIRDGEIQKISSEELVVDDIIVLQEGDRIPADAQLIEVTNLAVDEAVMNGEAFAIDKQIGHLVLSGTLAVKGHGIARVTATGLRTEIGKIGKVLYEPNTKRTHLQKEIDAVVYRVAILSILSAVTVTVCYGLIRGYWLEGSLAGIAAAMSLIPEELPIILTVFLGLGAWRMSRLGVIVRSNPAIELLGQVSVLCVDKTGTITKNEMALVEENTDVALYGLLASPQNPFDPMDKAFHVAAKIDDGWKLLREYPVSDKQLAICQAWETHAGSIQLAAKGAPETIADFCDFSEAQRADLIAKVDNAAKRGFRVLGVAAHELTHSSQLPDDPCDLPFKFIGLALLSDPVRQGVLESVQEMRAAGVKTVMITGDYPATAASIASDIGLENPQKILTGPEIEHMTDEQLDQAANSVNVYSRMLPNQKLRLVETFKRNAHVVAMTGDGVNDAPALKASHVGIAMGSRGSEVAREAADIVIADDSFISISNGMREGRRIYSNLSRAASYVIAIHIPIFGMALLPVFSSTWPLVLLPVQVALLELIIDPAASLAYENEALSPSEMKKPPRKLGDRFINKRLLFISTMQGLFLLAGTSGIYVWAISNALEAQHIKSITFATILLGNLFLMISNRSLSTSIFEILLQRTNTRVYVIFTAGIAVLVLMFTLAPIRRIFGFTALSVREWVLVLLAAALSVVWFEIYKVAKRGTPASRPSH